MKQINKSFRNIKVKMYGNLLMYNSVSSKGISCSTVLQSTEPNSTRGSTKCSTNNTGANSLEDVQLNSKTGNQRGGSMDGTQ
jgi:hypothetical protein